MDEQGAQLAGKIELPSIGEHADDLALGVHVRLDDRFDHRQAIRGVAHDRPLLSDPIDAVGASRIRSCRLSCRGIEWRRTAVLATFNFALFFPLLAVAVYRLPGGVAAAVGGLQPLLVVGVVLTKRSPSPPNRIAATGWQLLMDGIVLVPLSLMFEGAPPHVTGRNLVGFAHLALVGTALAFVVWFNGIRRLPAAAPPLLGLAGPVTGALLGWIVLGQSLSTLQLAGFAITLGAIADGTTLRAPTPGATDAATTIGGERPWQRTLPTSSPPSRYQPATSRVG